jgi:hypothetical protein
MASATRVSYDKEGDGNGYKSDGGKGDRRVTAMRAMATAMAMAMVTSKTTTWVMVMVMRLAGDKKGKGKGGKEDGDDDEDGGQQRGWGRQGNGNGNKGGRWADGDGGEEGDGGDGKIRGCRGRWWPTFAHHMTMTHDHDNDGNNNNNWHCWTQQSTAGMLWGASSRIKLTTMRMTDEDATINNWCWGWGKYN